MKPDTQYIWTMEDGFFHKSLYVAIKNIFPKGWFFKPWDLSKPQPYYRAILEATESVTFKDFFLGQNVTEAGYSTAKIHKILTPSDWGTHLHSPKQLPKNFTTMINHCRTYTYWDYHQAWYNTFMYQNSKNTHSWLIYFNLKMDPTHFPQWFLYWWKLFGCTPEILTSEIQESFNLFKTSFKPSDKEKRFPPILLFSLKFFFPWVFSWTLSYQQRKTQMDILRRFRVKWWNAFDSEPVKKPAVSLWLQKQGFTKPDPSATLFLAQRSFANT